VTLQQVFTKFILFSPIRNLISSSLDRKVLFHLGRAGEKIISNIFK